MISFGQPDHPTILCALGRLPLIINPLIGGYSLPGVLMDGGFRINILYTRTLQWMDIPLEALHPSMTEFCGIIPGNKVAPIGQITLQVAFGQCDNYRCELIRFVVVPYVAGYDAVLGRTAFAKFLAIPNYTYMQMKMPGPRGIITIPSSYLEAMFAEQANLEGVAERTNGQGEA